MSPAPVAPAELLFPLAFSGGGASAPSIRGTARLDADRLVLLPPSGPPRMLPLTEINSVAEAGPEILLTLAAGERVALSRLGHQRDGFLDALLLARAEALLRAFWMREERRAPDFAAEHLDRGGPRPCRLRLLETALAVLYPDAPPVRLPYALVEGIEAEGHRLTVGTLWRGTWTFAKLGRGFDPFTEALRTAVDDLGTAPLDLLRRALPGADSAALRAGAGLARDGVAFPASSWREAGLWIPLEQAVGRAGAAGPWEVLLELAGPAGPRLGLKRGLAGNLSGDYLFLLVPVAGARAAALEAVRLEKEDREPDGRATYLFRLDAPDGEALDALNRDLLELNFRREPLLAPEERLPRPRPAALDALRSRFLGRAEHRTPEGWKAELLALAGGPGKGIP